MTANLTRRQVAKLIGGTAGGLLLPSTALLMGAAAKEPTSLLTRAIPATGERLPVMGLGSAVTFDVRETWQQVDRLLADVWPGRKRDRGSCRQTASARKTFYRDQGLDARQAGGNRHDGTFVDAFS